MGVLIPFVVVRNYRRMVGKSLALPNRMRHFRTTAIMLVLLTSLSVVVARAEWIDLYRFDSARLPQGLAAGAVMYVLAVVFMRPRWRRAVEQRARIVHLFMPDNRTERAWWVLVSTLAGIGEEITWRGVQTALLAYLTGSFVAGAVLSAASFGVAHYIQGWKSAATIAVFALGFQAVVLDQRIAVRRDARARALRHHGGAGVRQARPRAGLHADGVGVIDQKSVSTHTEDTEKRHGEHGDSLGRTACSDLFPKKYLRALRASSVFSVCVDSDALTGSPVVLLDWPTRPPTARG